MRFVLLKHETEPQSGRTSHWDLLLQEWEGDSREEKSLRTFEFQQHPKDSTAHVCRELPYHRQLYLDYQGPLGGNRGTVERDLSGSLTWLKMERHELQFILEMDKGTTSETWWAGRLTSTDHWKFERLS